MGKPFALIGKCAILRVLKRGPMDSQEAAGWTDRFARKGFGLGGSMELLAQAVESSVMREIVRSGYLPWALICGTIVVVSVVKAIANAAVGIARERTRREIAAFIAEGSLSPEQGEKLMAAGKAKES
jgi:hypothetical protein